MPETQAFSAPRSSWTPPSGTLGELVRASHSRASDLLPQYDALRLAAETAPATVSLRQALLQPTVGVIAEVKRRSPSKGSINPGLDALSKARSYADAGAAAVSVLTEPDRFGGSIADLRSVASGVSVPVLRKDFIVAPVQLYEARANGAAAALLIVRALSDAALSELVEAGSAIGLELLVEVRDAVELERALGAGATVIGVNNRNLESLVIDSGTVERILPLIPRDVVAIAESGMASRADVQRAARAGADAVLIGSAVSAVDDAGEMVRSFTGVVVERDARPN
ncbi:MAG TPA: indole-3-glycerol phosphate synthase TrpC [Gemmatimonadaceae bacterium]|nr:indole-3-glycerol phosphate synthase TrpC [Gemmatimonadaceae bacterium]